MSLNMIEKDLSNLPKEELIKLLLDTANSNDSLAKENKKLLERIKALEEELKAKKLIIKRYNLERFFSRQDSAIASKLFNATKAREKLASDPKKTEAPSPKKERKKHNDLDKSLTEEELKRLAAKNPVITNEDLAKFDPSQYEVIELGERVSYVIMRIPAETRVYKVVTKTKKVVEKATGKKTFVRPEPINVSNSKYHSSVLAHIAFMKFYAGVPTLRYVRVESSQGIDIPLRTSYNLIISGAQMLSGVYEHMGKLIGDPRMSSLHIDESTVKAIDLKVKEDGTKRETCYMLLTTDMLDRKHLFSYYQFAEDRKLGEIKELLKDAHDITVHTDAYAAYD